MKPKRLLLDVDGPCNHFVRYCLDSVGSSFPVANVTKYNFFQMLDATEAIKLRELMINPLWWARIPRNDAARNFIFHVLPADWEVKFVTKPYLNCFGWESIRREWIKKNFDMGPECVIPVTNKEDVWGDVLFDDCVDNCLRWKKYHPQGQAIVFADTYNVDSQGLPRMNWKQFYELDLWKE